MRLVKRPEFMTLPAGTMAAPLLQKWVFGEPFIKGDTLFDTLGAKAFDFDMLEPNWVEADDSDEAIDRLEEMYADSSVSYPAQMSVGREGLYDDDRVYLVYEAADVVALVQALGLGVQT
jgi:hypothetical protein